MKKLGKILVSLLCAATMAVPVVFAACEDANNSGDKGNQGGNKPPVEAPLDEWVDYVSQLTLDFTSDTKKQEVKVRTYVDGDTTHFDPITNSTLTPYNAADFAKTDGYVKARYLAINTPESTGQIEEWGKKASKFTRSKLEEAEKPGGSIVIESDTPTWDRDSTGERYTLWIWYRLPGATEYRNLNVEILQEGLAYGSSTANNRYGTIASAALAQAKAYKKYVFSGEKDPEFYYGDAIPVTLKELRCHIEDYNGLRVRVTGVITSEFDNSVYMEEKDDETGVYFGMAVYYGFTKGTLNEVLVVGYEVNVVGVVSYYETGDTWQLSDIHYSPYNPDDPKNSSIVSTDYHAPAYAEVTPTLFNGNLTATFTEEDEDGEIVDTHTKTLPYGEAIMSTTVSLKNVRVKSVSTTQSGQSAGAMTLLCEDEAGNTIKVRTEVLRDENNQIITADAYKGKTISVKGLVEKYYGEYQVKVYRADFIDIVG